MKKLKSRLFSVAALSTFLTLMVLSAIVFYSCRSNWVFVGNTVGMSFFPMLLLILMILNAVVFSAFIALRLYKKDVVADKKICTAVLLCAEILSAILFIFALIYGIGYVFSENREVFFLFLKESLSEAFVFIFIGFLALFFPALGCKAKKAVSAVALSVITVICIWSIVPLNPYKITSEPMVIDNGEGYSVVFSTSGCGTGYIEYTYEGKDYKVVDQTGGRLNADSKIHSMNVPYEHLKNNSYKVGSVRVIEQFSYGSRLGKEVVSGDYTFTCPESDSQTWLIISDWHTMLDEAYDAISYTGDYDAVILLGDSTPGVDFEEQVVTNTVQFGGKVSGGTKPVLYVRGNHETRGAYAGKLMTRLGLDSFYYTSDIGPYSFVVLDSGEDKEDSHSEYGGMTDYNTSRANMIEWLKGVEVKNEKVITLSHAWQISDVEEDLSLAGWDEIDRIGARLILSGHTHQCRLIGDASDEEQKIFSAHPGIIGYMDGGKQGKTYTASKMTLSSDGFSLVAFNNSGEKVFDEAFEW